MKIDESVLSVIGVRISQYPTDNKHEFLLVGRSNVGKSSFINTLLGRKNYAHISSKPGKTQTLNFYLCNNNFYLVDVPGYGYANVSKSVQKKFGLMIEEYLMNRDNLTRVFMLIDSRMKPTENDVLMYNFLKHYNLPVTIVSTKYDKLNAKDKAKVEKNIYSTLDIKEGDNVVYFSSISKKGRDEIYKILELSIEAKNLSEKSNPKIDDEIK